MPKYGGYFSNMDYEVWKKYNESTSLEDCPGEEWREIEGYSEICVSNYGRVKSKYRGLPRKDGVVYYYKPKIYNSSTTTNGYTRIPIKDPVSGKWKTVGLHRIIAMAFISNPDRKPHIDHINGNRVDNRLSNLRWVTRVENMNNPIALERLSKSHIGIIPGANTRRKMSERSNGKRRKKILHYDQNGVLLETFDYAKDASALLGVTSSCISAWCRGVNLPPDKHIWKYAE